VAAVMGPDTENNVAYQAVPLLLSFLMLAIGFGWLFRGQFAAERVLPRFGTVGEPFTYSVLLRNLGRKQQTGLTLLENLADPRPGFKDWLAAQKAEEKSMRAFRVSQHRRTHPFKVARLKPAAIPAAAAGENVTVEVELVPMRRGLLRFGGITLARTDPLGLFCAFHKLSLPQSALILPRRYPLPPIDLPGTMRYQKGGVALATSVGRSDEFVSLRDYRHGDPIRHIHWRSWARAGKPVVREFEDEFFVRHALVLDTFVEHPQSEVFEEAVSVAASFACGVLTQESLLDLLFVGNQSYCFTSGRGLAHADQMLEILASVRPCSEHQFEALETLVINHSSLVSGCICIFLAWDKERQRFVEKLKMLGLPVMVLVIVEAGGKKGLELGAMQDDPARFHVLEVGKVKEGLAKFK